MKATMPVLVIAVGTKGHRSLPGGAPVSSCGCEGDEHNAPMIAIPLKALEVDTEDGQGAMPEVGDEIELTGVKGVVRKVDGEEAYVEVKEVNGMPVEYEHGKPGEGESEDAMTEDGMRKMAMRHDREMGMED